jgi:hypothetical protein
MSRARTDSSGNLANTDSPAECWLVTRIGFGYASSSPTVRATIGTAVGSTISAAIGPAVGSTISAAIGPAVGSTISAAIGPAVGPAIGPAVGPAIGSAICTTVGPTVGSAVTAAPADTEASSIGTTIRAAIPDTGDALGTPVSWALQAGNTLVGILR